MLPIVLVVAVIAAMKTATSEGKPSSMRSSPPEVVAAFRELLEAHYAVFGLRKNDDVRLHHEDCLGALDGTPLTAVGSKKAPARRRLMKAWIGAIPYLVSVREGSSDELTDAIDAFFEGAIRTALLDGIIVIQDFLASDVAVLKQDDSAIPLVSFDDYLAVAKAIPEITAKNAFGRRWVDDVSALQEWLGHITAFAPSGIKTALTTAVKP